VFRSVAQLVDAIRRYVDHHNTNPTSFVWTKKAEDILQKSPGRGRLSIKSHLRETLH